MSDLFSPRFAPPPPPSPPPAPPLPPSRYVNRATTALARIAQPFIGVSRPASAQANRVSEGYRPIVPAAIPDFSSPVSSQTATHKTGIPISAVDISPQRTHAILAGREILKTVRVSGTNCAEEFNLRAAIIAYASTHNSGFAGHSSRIKDNLAAEDVKWSHGNFNTTIATAAANGRIILYDINRAGVELARLHEHHRQVHRLAINPHQGYYLLSGSQDATLKLWDLRAMAGGRNVMSFRSSRTYSANADGIRDVKWSPTDGTEFACGTDAGVVQRWDFRRDNAPLLKIAAHRTACQSVDWHPDGKYLASAGADKMVRVWDFPSFDRRQNAAWSFRAPQPVTKVRWRPAQWTMNPHGAGAWETSQLVTAYNHQEPRVHVWNFLRPFVPFREIDQFNSAPTDMLWHSGDLLWTVSLEGIFTQTDVYFATNPNYWRNVRALDLASDGEITFCAQRRLPAGFGIVSGVVPSPEGRVKQPKAGSGERLSGSRSTPEEEGSASFLGTSFRLRHGRTWSAKSTKSAGNTPPSENFGLVVKKLDEIIEKRSMAKPLQSVFHGYIEASPDMEAYRTMATQYRIDGKSIADQDPETAAKDLSDAMLHNARVAESVGFYRIAQTWRILNQTLSREQRLYKEEQFKLAPPTASESYQDLAKQASFDALGANEAEILQNISTHDFALTAAMSDIAEYSAGSGEGLSVPATQSAHPEFDSRGVIDSRAHPTSSGDDQRVVPLSAVDGSAFNAPHAMSERGEPAQASTTIFSGTESPSASLHSAHWDRYLTGNESISVVGGQVTEAMLRLQLDSTQSMAQESPPQQIDRIDSVESLSMFPASSNESHYHHSRPDSRGNAVDERIFLEQGVGTELPESEYATDSDRTATAGPTSEPHSGLLAPITPMEIPEGDVRHAPGQDVHSLGGQLLRSIGRPSSMRSVSDSLNVPSQGDSSRVPSGRVPTISMVSASRLASSSVEDIPAIKGIQLAAGRAEDPFSLANILIPVFDYYSIDQGDMLMSTALLLLLHWCLPEGHIDELRAAAIFRTYHEQLVSQELYIQACELRNYCYPRYPSVYWSSSNTEIKFACGDCKAPIRVVPSTRTDGHRAWMCEKCGKSPAPCPVCYERRHGGLWRWCFGCGHGGHDSCLQEVWAFHLSEGRCAVDGCPHICQPKPDSQLKEQLKSRRSSIAKEKDRSAVRGDEWVVGESKAVERLRGGLAGAGGSMSGGSSATGHHHHQHHAAMEKRVKVVSPEEEEENNAEQDD